MHMFKCFFYFFSILMLSSFLSLNMHRFYFKVQSIAREFVVIYFHIIILKQHKKDLRSEILNFFFTFQFNAIMF